MKPQKFITATLLLLTISLVSFAEGTKKSKKLKTTTKACIENILNEFINEDINTFNFNNDLEIASQQFEDVYQEASLMNDLNADLEIAEKIFFDIQKRSEEEKQLLEELIIADQIFEAIEMKPSL